MVRAMLRTAALVFCVFLVSTAISAAGRLQYPTDLNQAVQKAYPNLTGIRRTCEVSSNNGRSLEALALMIKSNSRGSTPAS